MDEVIEAKEVAFERSGWCRRWLEEGVVESSEAEEGAVRSRSLTA